jgi:amino acid adenylation domain-containing protein/FkbH-like protein
MSDKTPQQPSAADPNSGNSQSNFTSLQAAVARVWAEVLEGAEIGPESNFFDLGGDSLKAMEVISRIHGSMNVEIPLIAFFEEPTVSHIAEVVGSLQAGGNGGGRDSIETKLAQIWAEVLGVPQVARGDNFFDVGGDSLKAMEVISRIHGSMNVEIPLIAFFEDPTIVHLAEVVKAGSQAMSEPAASQAAPGGPLPLSYPQLTFWLLQQSDPVGYLYNEPRVLRIRGGLRAEVLQQALDAMCRRHESLRTRFQPGPDEPVQVIDPAGTIQLHIEDLTSISSPERENAALGKARAESQRAFDLFNEPPLRATLFKLTDEDHLLAVVIHHVLSDGYTSAIFFDELSVIYNALLAGKPVNLPEPVPQYREYAFWERLQMQGNQLEEQLDFWRAQLKGAPARLDLPCDQAADPVTHRGRSLSVSLSAATSAKIKSLAQVNGTTLFTVMMSALRIMLHRWTSQRDIVIGTVVSNRTWSRTERMLGCFLNFLPLRGEVVAGERSSEVLAREKRIVMDAFAHQACPFVKIAAHAAAARAGESNPVYNVAFLLQNFPEMKFSAQSLASEFLELDAETALLDLRFVATETPDGVKLECEFKTDLFEAATVSQLLKAFTETLEAMAQDDGPARLVSQFTLPADLVEQAAAARQREKKTRFVVASTFTAEPLESPLAFWMKELGVRPEFEFAPYNQVFQQLLDPASSLAKNSGGTNIILLRLTDWMRFEESADDETARGRIEQNVRDLAGILRSSGNSAPTLLCICPAEKHIAQEAAWAGFLARMEQALASELGAVAGLHVVTSSQVLEWYPVENYDDPYADKLGHIPYTPEFFASIASMLARRIFSLRSAPRKVIVLDCDNTLWKGVCGEEGPTGVSVDPPRRALQQFMLRQVEAGMLLALCSKNAEEDVDAVFAQNPGMLLRTEHVAARRVNWNSKAHNLRELAAELKLGIDSFVFIDDNPIEAAEVQAQCPEVLTLLLPSSEEQIPRFLKNVWALDHWKVTDEDARRTAMYRQNAGREQLRKQAATLDEFLAGLELDIQIRPMAEGDLARVAQLTERTNQFNFTTIRRNEKQISELIAAGGECWIVNLRDRFGDYGLVGAVLFSTDGIALTVDSLLLSCRALGRKVEHKMLARLGQAARERELQKVIAKFVPTKKNQPALDFLESIGGNFRHAGTGHFVYAFPAGYAADAHLLKAAAVVEENVPASAETRPGNSGIPAENRLLARIAAELNTPEGILRAIETQRRAVRRSRGAFVAPRTPLEEMVAAAWAQLLKVDRVGVHDDFFALGGHSLLATQAVARIRRTLGVELPLRSMFESPTVAEFARRVEEARRGERATQLPPITRVASLDSVPLSFAQQRLWFLDQLEPGNPLYNIPQMVRARGRLDVAALHRALNKVVERHESLRTTFAVRDNEPVQVIAPRLEIPLPLQDLSSDPHRERTLLQLTAHEAARIFDLSNGPLLRAQLVKLGAEDHALLLTMHHIVSDRWSMGLMSEELAAHYSAFVCGNPSPLPELAVQYPDFAAWQRKWLQGEALEKQIAYWKQHLSGAPPVLELPSDHPRPAVMSNRGATQSVILPRELLEKLSALSNREGVTLFMTLLSAFQTLLSRYSGQEDIVIGSPIANRQYAEVEPLIGFFVNTLALRGNVSGDPDFRTLLQRTRDACLQAYAHQDIPFEKLVEELQPQRSLSHSPIFQVMFALQNAPMQALELAGLHLERVPVYPGTSMFDMSWFAMEVPQGLMVRAEYSTDLFEPSTITRALAHFRHLLESAVEEPEQRVSQLRMLGEEERRKVLVEFNATQAEFAAGLCMADLFEQSVMRSPQATAVVCGGERLSYAELNARANRIAHYLRKQGAGRDVLVGVFLERTPDLLAAILGVLKSGAAYVPLDPGYPAERLRAILEDANAAVVLTQPSLMGELEKSSARVIALDREWGKIGVESEANPGVEVRPQDLGYVLFTSGSTGRPKGVAIEQHSAVTLVQWAQREYTREELAGVLLSTSVCFDLSIFEIFVALSVGGKIIVVQNALYLPSAEAKEEVTLINTVPSAMAELVRMGGVPRSVQVVNLAGEALPESLVEEIYATTSTRKVFNLYGPTEDTTYSTWTLVPRQGKVTIGRPLPNTQAYVLDGNRNPQAVGVPGELYLAGEGLARGYFGRADLTAERFVANPYAGRDKQNQRMYRTGDLCRWRGDGQLEYLGRMDHQVKLRGFRIELGEIEAVLGKHAGVRQSLVMAREDEPGQKRLVAYVVAAAGPGSEIDEDALRTHLKQSLPEFMIPSAFVQLETFPLTPNGKIDRKALPKPEYTQQSGAAVSPRDELEAAILKIWRQLLNREAIGVTDNFFDVGGHSLLAVRMMSEIRRTLGRELPLVTLFKGATVEYLARVLRGSESVDQTNAKQIQAGEERLPTFFAAVLPGVNALGYVRLAKRMGAEQPFFTLQAPGPGLRALKRPYTQQEYVQLAAQYIEAMRSVQPRGPYYLGGTCEGARIAFEMTRQLEAQGDSVSLLAVLDTWALENTQNRALWRVYYYSQRLKQFWTLPWDEKKITVQRVLRRRVNKLAGSKAVMESEWMGTYWPGEEFVPAKVQARITVLRLPKQPFYYHRDPSLGWGQRTRSGVDLEIIPNGRHLLLLREPYVREVGEILAKLVKHQISGAPMEAYKMDGPAVEVATFR